MNESVSNIFTQPFGIAMIIVAILFLISLCIISMWKKVPQDKALVVTGLRKRVISGGGGIVIPLLERSDIISLENMQITVKIKGLTSTGVDIEVGALTIIKIKNEAQKILAAMEQFNTGRLDGTIRNITETSKEVLEGKLREILSGLTVEEIYQNREKFATSVQEVATKELEDMGLEIKAFTIKEITDDQGYLDSLGKKQVAEVKKNALIAESNARKEQEITIAKNNRETAVIRAELERDTTIRLAQTKQEEQEAQAEADVKIAEAQRLKEIKILENTEATQRKQAQVDVAYDVEKNKSQKEIIETDMQAKVLLEEKNIELTKVQMEVQRTKEEQETIVAKQKALRRQEELNSEIQKDAEAQAAKIKTMAEADLFKRTKDAEAKKVEEVKIAEAAAAKKTLDAEAEAVATKATSLAEAEATKAKGLAEAEATKAKGLAEAEAVRAEGLAQAQIIREKAFAEAEAMLKKAEAYAKYGEAAKMEMFIKVLPEVTKAMSDAVVSSVSQIGNISVIDTGSGSGANNISSIATKLLTEIPEVVKATTGVDLKKMIKDATSAKSVENKNRLLDMKAEDICSFVSNSQLQDMIRKELSSGTIEDYIEKNGKTNAVNTLSSVGCVE